MTLLDHLVIHNLIKTVPIDVAQLQFKKKKQIDVDEKYVVDENNNKSYEKKDNAFKESYAKCLVDENNNKSDNKKDNELNESYEKHVVDTNNNKSDKKMDNERCFDEINVKKEKNFKHPNMFPSKLLQKLNENVSIFAGHLAEHK